jgi:hypothetical protein
LQGEPAGRRVKRENQRYGAVIERAVRLPLRMLSDGFSRTARPVNEF